MRLGDLHDAIAAVCPIVGLSNVNGVVSIDFDATATTPQKSAAQAVVAGFDLRDRRARTIPSIVTDLQALRTSNAADFTRLQAAVMAVVIQQNPKLARTLNIALDGDEVAS